MLCGVSVTDTTYNYAFLGVVLLCAIFQGSTNLTEKITASKYPEYAEYQRLVGKFLPKFNAFWDSSSQVEDGETKKVR